MRNLFLALVLANLAFAAWHLWFSEPEPLPPAARTGGPSITLMSEAAPAGASVTPTEPSPRVQPPAGADVVAVPAAAAAPAAPRCVSVGPFRELSQAATAAANLRAAGYDPTQRVAEGEVWVGYWVYIERIPTEDEANEILANLRANGISDSYVIPDSGGNNLISLGVFSEIGRAGTRREQVRALGYEPTVTDRTRRGTVYWVDVLLDPGQTLDFEVLQVPGRILRLEQRACESV
ncbi:MAG TPA: SPOR domain-containing protein [Gammaproteobacteria bacterium]